jgi:hypothetical protein
VEFLVQGYVERSAALAVLTLPYFDVSTGFFEQKTLHDAGVT